jgi:membrane protein
MPPPAYINRSGSAKGEGDLSQRGPIGRWVTTARGRFEGSWLQDLAARLKTIDFVNSIVVFGASLLLAMLPFIILLSSLANERIDDDVSRHIGLDRRGAHIIEGLFRKSPSHSATSIFLALLIAFVGTMTVASSLQATYERVFDQEHGGWRGLPRFIIWVVALSAALIAEGSIDGPAREVAGSVGRGVLSVAWTAIFFAWTMHFLLAGRVQWRRLALPALTTALLWLALSLFSSHYFSSTIITEDRLYGTIGAVFVLLNWLIAVGAVVVLGACGGAVWQARRDRRSTT